MLLQIYKKNLLPNTLGLLAYALLLRLPHLYFNTPWLPSNNTSMLGQLVGFSAGIFWQLFSVVCAFLCAVMINRLFIRNRLTSEINLYPGMIFLLLLSATPTGWSWHISMVVLLLVLTILDHIYKSYKHTETKGETFNVGVCTGLIVLLYPQAFLLIFFAFIGFFIIRNFRIKEVFQCVLGLICPFYVVGAVAYFLGSFSALKAHLLQPFGFFLYNDLNLNSPWLFIAIPLLFIAISLALYGLVVAKNNNQAVKKINILYWLLLMVALCVPIGYAVDISIVSLAIVPVSLTIGILLSRRYLGFWAELIHVFLIGISLYLQIKLYI